MELSTAYLYHVYTLEDVAHRSWNIFEGVDRGRQTHCCERSIRILGGENVDVLYHDTCLVHYLSEENPQKTMIRNN